MHSNVSMIFSMHKGIHKNNFQFVLSSFQSVTTHSRKLSGALSTFSKLTSWYVIPAVDSLGNISSSPPPGNCGIWSPNPSPLRLLHHNWKHCKTKQLLLPKHKVTLDLQHMHPSQMSYSYVICNYSQRTCTASKQQCLQDFWVKFITKTMKPQNIRSMANTVSDGELVMASK